MLAMGYFQLSHMYCTFSGKIWKIYFWQLTTSDIHTTTGESTVIQSNIQGFHCKKSCGISGPYSSLIQLKIYSSNSRKQGYYKDLQVYPVKFLIVCVTTKMLSATHYMHFEFIMHRISNSCGEVERAKAINSSDIQEVNHGRKSEAAFLLHCLS